MRQNYRAGMEDQLGALGLALNAVVLWCCGAVVLWNSLCLVPAAKQLAADGFPVIDGLLARLSPLRFDHINFLGRYACFRPARTTEASSRLCPSGRTGSGPENRSPPRGYGPRLEGLIASDRKSRPALTYNRDSLPFPENLVPPAAGLRSWDDLDPARHPFRWDADEEARLSALVREWVPPVLSGMAGC